MDCFPVMRGDTGKVADGKAQNSTLDKQWAKSFIDRIDMRFPKKIVSGDSVALAFLLVNGALNFYGV
jgi:hypothetical protein